MLIPIRVGRTYVEAGNLNLTQAMLTTLRCAPARSRQSVMLSIDGYGNDPRPLPDIPEVKAFVRRLHAVFPWWFYYLAPMPQEVLNSPVTMVFSCVLKNFVQPTRDELTDFIAHGVQALNSECQRVGDPESVNRDLIAGVESWAQSYVSLFQ